MTRLRIVPATATELGGPAADLPGYRHVEGHQPDVLPSDVLPRGWPEAWTWDCTCGATSTP